MALITVQCSTKGCGLWIEYDDDDFVTTMTPPDYDDDSGTAARRPTAANHDPVYLTCDNGHVNRYVV